MTTRTIVDDAGPDGVARTATRKYCTGCGRWKLLKHFTVDRATKDGYRHHCTQCRRPKQQAINKRYYRKHRDDLAAQRAQDRPLLKASRQARRAADPNAAREYDRWRTAEYRRRNADRINARNRANYAARKAAAKGAAL